jgi:GDPmannose 4,6-dehydratase
MTGPRVLITGSGGQDGRLLAEELSMRGWAVTGVVLPGSPDSPVTPELNLVEADLADLDACRRIVSDVKPDFVFHLAAISSVARSWAEPVQTAQVNGMASVALMAACLELTQAGHHVRFVNASSGEIYAGTGEVPQTEATSLAPTSPYGAAKAFAHCMADTFRSGGLWVSNAILYNHESPLRAKTFVTRKITSTAVEIAAGSEEVLRLGNLDARRDWGWAPDYVDCMIRMALHDRPDNFVVATGRSRSVRDFVAAAFAAVGIEDWRPHVEVDPEFVRPTDPGELVGDASKAHSELGWETTKSFTEIVAAMVSADCDHISAADVKCD